MSDGLPQRFPQTSEPSSSLQRPSREGFLIFQEDFLRIKDQWKMAHRHDVQYQILYVRHVDNQCNQRWRRYAEVVISMLIWDAMKH